MRANGHQLREIVSTKTGEIGTIRQLILANEGNIADLFQKLEQAEEDLARVQTLQMVYNSSVRVTVQGRNMLLGCAVKLIGGADRLVAQIMNTQLPERQHAQLLQRAKQRASALKSAVALANMTEMDIEE